MASSKKVDYFDGKGDVNAFIVKVELYNKLKKYQGEDAAVSLASRLQEPAFNVYLRMSEEDRKDVEKIKAELKKQYEVGNSDREEALKLLTAAQRKHDETAKDFSYRIGELVKLAYPTFSAESKLVHEKDTFVRGLHPEMQMKIKTLENFATLDMKGILEHTVRLEVAGVKSVSKPIKEEVNNVDSIASGSENKLLSRLDGLEEAIAKISVGSNSNPFRGRYRNSRPPKGGRKCWNCGDSSHVLRQCPERFCAACGERGHDAGDKKCSKSS